KCIDYKKKYGTRYLVINYRMMGHKYCTNKLFDKGYEMYKNAVEDEGNLGPASLSVDYAYLGWAYFKMDPKNNFEKANEHYDTALRYNDSISKKNSKLLIGYKLALERKIWSLRALNRHQEADKIKLELLSAKDRINQRKKDDKFKEFRLNNMLGLKSKNNRLNRLRRANELQKERLDKQRVLNMAFSLLGILSLVLLYLFYGNRKNLRKIKFLNKKLRGTLSDVEDINQTLHSRNVEITRLLNLNERTLFSKVLQVSTYRDVMNKMANDLSRLIESGEPIRPGQLFTTEKTLRGLIDEKEVWDDFRIQFEKTRPDFFGKLKKTVPDLTVNELKHCAYVVSKLRTKEVSNLINVSPRSVETARYRIKKKLGLNKEESLFDFLQGLNMDTGKGVA
ncbi:MAG: helix-turn-helix transcriptional regulator, partial [Flavobacteriaceae bacterium]